MKTILLAIDGRFGKRVLKPSYRRVWQSLTYGAIIVAIFKFILFPILEWWQGIVDFLNYVIWG